VHSASAGFTLIELLVTIAMVSLLVLFSLPGLQPLLQRHSGNVAILDLERLLAQARASAVNSGQVVTLCRSMDGLRCNGQWRDGILLFTDTNADRTINGEDRVLRHASNLAGDGDLRLSTFPNRQYLQYTAEGFTNKQNGAFTWCPPGGEPEAAQQLIFSQSGRTRLARDQNGDGIREGADGRKLSCR